MNLRGIRLRGTTWSPDPVIVGSQISDRVAWALECLPDGAAEVLAAAVPEFSANNWMAVVDIHAKHDVNQPVSVLYDSIGGARHEIAGRAEHTLTIVLELEPSAWCYSAVVKLQAGSPGGWFMTESRYEEHCNAIASPVPAALTVVAGEPRSGTSLMYDTLFDRLADPNRERAAIDAINDFTRHRMREDGFFRRILPPLEVSEEELAREPNGPALVTRPAHRVANALTLPSLPTGRLPRVSFGQIQIPTFRIDSQGSSPGSVSPENMEAAQELMRDYCAADFVALEARMMAHLHESAGVPVVMLDTERRVSVEELARIKRHVLGLPEVPEPVPQRIRGIRLV